MARTSDRREFLQASHHYKKDKHFLNGWFLSHKLDGMRAFWDGGITRGMYCHEIPFANTAKDGIRLSPPKATGLWSKYAKPIQAPAWFLDELPDYPLDGELYAGVGNFQQVMSTARKLSPIDDEWEKITYAVFDLPDLSLVFADGTVNCPHWTKSFKGLMAWVVNNTSLKSHTPKLRRFEAVQYLLNQWHNGEGIVQAVKQTQLPFGTDKCYAMMEEEFNKVLDAGGEGIVLRHHNSIWEPQRSHYCVKLKGSEDCEVTVTGYIAGKETDRGSKLLGLMGAMIVDFNGKRLELSGFTDEERLMEDVTGDSPFEKNTNAFQWCCENPGKEVPPILQARQFPRGTVITIKYRELTDDGLPKEARFQRIRPDE